jgi:single-strand DNA-binding protein
VKNNHKERRNIMMNVCVLSGRLTSDPKFAPGKDGDSNKDRASFTLAVKDVHAKEPRADFIPMVAWGVNAKNISTYCKQGKAVTIKGHLRTNTVDNADGTKSYFWECVVENVEFGADAKNQKGKTEAVAPAATAEKSPLDGYSTEQLDQLAALIAARGAVKADPFPTTVSA